MIAQLLNEIYQVNLGQCTALDQELEVLIRNIETHGCDSVDQVALDNIIGLRQKLQNDLEQQHQFVCEKNNELAQVNGISSELLPQISTLTETIEPVTPASLLGKLSQVLDNYHVALSALDNAAKESTLEQNRLFRKSKESFIDLYHDIHVNISYKPQLHKLMLELQESRTTDSLLSNCKELITLLLKNINSEKETSQHFLQALNEALLNVKDIVNESGDVTAASMQARLDWDKSVNKNLNNIENVVKQSDSQVLRRQISQEVTDLVKAMGYKQSFDQLAHEALTEQFEKMQQQLSLVEAQAQNYKTQLEQQKQLSLQDTLTKLPNRAALNQRFAQEFENAQEHDQPLWVVVADIDHFKNINDSFGHNAGDKTLQVIASTISKSLRGSEFIARYGGEEFVFLVPLATKQMLSNILERVRTNIKAIPFRFKSESLSITISLGATKVRLDDSNPEETFERADQALYKAKNSGRDQVVID